MNEGISDIDLGASERIGMQDICPSEHELIEVVLATLCSALAKQHSSPTRRVVGLSNLPCCVKSSKFFWTIVLNSLELELHKIGVDHHLENHFEVG